MAAAAGNLFIAYVPLSALAAFSIIAFVGSTFLGFKFGEGLPSLGEDPAKQRLLRETLLNLLALAVSFAVLAMWRYIMGKYGDIASIMRNAYEIRAATIGASESIYPVWLGYLGSLSYGLLPLGLAYGRRSIAIVAFGDIVLLDLVSFGRVGIVYALFVVVGHMVLTERRRISLRQALLIFGLIAVLIAPRLIRGGFDNFEGTMRAYRPFLKAPIPPALNIVASNYIYYFSAPYALSEYLREGYGESPPSPGTRTLAPLANIASRISGAPRETLVDAMAAIPFPYNIYSAIHDWLADYGALGLLVGPFSTCMAFAFLARGSGPGAKSMRLYAIAYLFYSPIYYIFGFGGFFISLLMLGSLRLFGASWGTAGRSA